MCKMTYESRNTKPSVATQLCCLLRSIPLVSTAAFTIAFATLCCAVYNQFHYVDVHLYTSLNIASQQQNDVVRGVVVVVVSHDRMTQVGTTIQSVNDAFLQRHSYKLICVSDSTTVKQLSEQDGCPSTVSLDLQTRSKPSTDTITASLLQEVSTGKILKEFDYIWLLEAGVQILYRVPFDLFGGVAVKRMQLAYAKTGCTIIHTESSIWDAAAQSFGTSGGDKGVAGACATSNDPNLWSGESIDPSFVLLNAAELRSDAVSTFLTKTRGIDDWTATSIITILANGPFRKSSYELSEVGWMVDGTPQGSVQLRMRAHREMMTQISMFAGACAAILVLTLLSITKGARR